MKRSVVVRLVPSGLAITADPGTSLQDLLFEHGVEFPCGGMATCGKCRVRVLKGDLPPSDEDEQQLGQEAVNEGWRLACCATLSEDVTLQLGQWDTNVLLDETPIRVSPREGVGVAIDLGTTTLAAQLVDLQNGNILAVKAGLNPQARYGGDIMSRVHYAVNDNGAERLTREIRDCLGRMIVDLLQQDCRRALRACNDDSGDDADHLREVVIVGNTVMHHLFCGHDLSPLASCPFDTRQLSEMRFTTDELKWELMGTPTIRFLPCFGGFIGSDVLAGVIASGMDRSDRLQVLIDLGTNGEIVVSNSARLLCAATAAGPAFEGARIQMGMRAAIGAIDRVRVNDQPTSNLYDCHVIGNVDPKGICGSGLIDAAACALQAGDLALSGRLIHGSERLQLAGDVSLHQCDIRELQLAKGAIAAGVEMLLSRLGKTIEDIDELFLCGAFGNYLDIRNAVRLGLITCGEDKVVAMGNTALLGAKIILLSGGEMECRIKKVCETVERFGLSEDRDFMDIYVAHMPFPD